MKILYLVHQFYPEFYTGTEKFVMNLAHMFQKRGMNTKVITYSFADRSTYKRKYGKVLEKAYTYEGIPVRALRIKPQPIDFDLRTFNKDLQDMGNEIMHEESPDVIHVGHPMRIASIMQRNKHPAIPYIVTLTDFYVICPKFILLDAQHNLCAGPKGGSECRSRCPEISFELIQDRLEFFRIFLKNAAKVVSPSQFVRRLVQDEYPEVNINVINHGLSYSTLQRNVRTYKDSSQINILFAGNLARHKGLHVLLDACDGLQQQNYSLKVFGSGTDKVYMKMINDLSKQVKSIEFKGVFSPKKWVIFSPALTLLLSPQHGTKTTLLSSMRPLPAMYQ